MRAYPPIRKTDGVGAGMAEYIEGHENPARGRRAGRTALGARDQARVTLVACGPVSPACTSNSTACPSTLRLALTVRRCPPAKWCVTVSAWQPSFGQAAVREVGRTITRRRTGRDTARDCATLRGYSRASPGTARARGTVRDRRPRAA